MASTREITLNEINSDAFISRLKANDEQYFSDLFSFIVPKLCNFLSIKFKFSDLDGEEIAADTMIKVSKSIANFNPNGGAKLSTWIFRIAQNTAIDFLRHQAKQPEDTWLDVDLDNSVSRQIAQRSAKQWFRNNAVDASQKNEISSQIKLMKHALNNLDEQDRNLLLMKQNMEYEEIAEAEHVSVPTLRTRYSRALDRLRKELKKEENL